MGKIINKQIQGMHWWSKISLVLILTLAASVFMYEGLYKPKPVQAAITNPTNWTQKYAAVAYPAGTVGTNFNITAGSNRLLVVAIASTRTSTGTQTVTNVTWNGQPLTLAVGDAATASDWNHTYLYYLKDASMPAATTAAPLTVTITGGTAYYTTVHAAVYAGVDQTTPFTDANNTNAAGIASSTCGPTGLIIAANDQAIQIVNLARSSANTTPRTMQTWDATNAAGWTTAGIEPAPITTSGPCFQVYIRDRNLLTATTDNSTHTADSGNTWDSISAMSIKAYVPPVDSTPPTAGTVTISPDVSGTYTSPAPTITTIFTDAESAVSLCQYTTNGSTWVAGTVSGIGPNYTCTANPTGLSGFLNINMRATSAGGGPTTAIQIQRTVDAAVPSDGTLTVTAGNALNNLSWTAAVDTGGSGIASYILRYATGTTAPASCAVGTAVPGSPFSAATLSTTHTGLTNGTPYSYRLCATDNLGNTSGGVTGTATPNLVVGPPSTITSCNGCHGYTTTFADGTARNVPPGQFQGSHNNHVISGGIVCSTCHVAPATTTSADFNHANGTLAMATPINGDAGATYSKGSSIAITNATFSGGTCSSTKCHGTTSPAWGNNTNNNVCTKCHGTPTAGTPTPVQIAPTTPVTAAHNVHLAGSTIGKLVVCTECHENVVAVTTSGHMDGIKTIQYNGPVGTAQSTVPSGSYPASCGTTWCHGGNTTSIPQNKPTARTAPVWGTTFGTTSVLGDALGVTSVNTGSGRCANCHGFPPATASHAGTSLAGAKPCNSCHNNLKTDGTFVDPSLHVNGTIEGGSCVGCHSTGGPGDVNGRVAVVSQFTANGNSHHYQGAAAVDGSTCYACHWEADASGNQTSYHAGTNNGVVDLVVWGSSATRPTVYAGNSVTYQSGGTASSSRTELAKINNHCIGCHNATNAARFSGDTNAPSQYAWDGLSIDARYSNTGTTSWGKFSGNDTNNKSTQTKSFSAHGKATTNQRGWSTVVDTYPSAVATSNVLCFDCHNSHGSSTAAAGITSSYSSATGRRKGGILKDVTNGKGGYVTTYKATAGGSAATKNVYNAGAGLCFDCHNTPSAGVTPWGYTSTFGFTPPAGQLAGTGIVGYFDTPYFGQAGTNFISTLDFAYKAGLSANQGGHLSASTSKGAFTGTITKRSFDPATPSGTVIQGLCTPCHDPHGVSTSLGTNQQYAVPLLKGTFVTSPYKQDSAPSATNEARGGSSRGPNAMNVGSTPAYYIDQRSFQSAGTGKPNTARYWNFAANATTLQTTNDTQFAGLCTGCHAKTALTSTAAASAASWKTMTRIHNSVKGWAAATGTGGNLNNKVHAYTCSKCHTPHNSRLPRLLITNCLDVKHRGRVASGGNMAASNTASGSSGAGSGRFPGGGGGSNGRSSATNPGPWFFGTSNGSSSSVPAVPACHASATAGGSTFTTAGQLWNTKSPW